MTLPSAPNSIAKSQVNVELGRSATAEIRLSDSAVRTLAGSPSGEIRMSSLRGKSFNPITVSNRTVSQTRVTPTPATATFTLTGSGAISQTGGGGGSWLSPAVNMSLYEVAATAPSITSGTLNTYMQLGVADRSWSLTQSNIGTTEVPLTIFIREIANPGVTLGSAVITLRATVTG